MSQFFFPDLPFLYNHIFFSQQRNYFNFFFYIYIYIYKKNKVIICPSFLNFLFFSSFFGLLFGFYYIIF